MAEHLPRTTEASLLGIPAEIRVQIFSYLFTGSTVSVGMDERDEQFDTKITGGKMAWNILRVCKLFKNEAEDLPRLSLLVLKDVPLLPGVGNMPTIYLERIRFVQLTNFALKHTNPRVWQRNMRNLEQIEVLTEDEYSDIFWGNTTHLSPVIEHLTLFVRTKSRELIRDMFEGSMYASRFYDKDDFLDLFHDETARLGIGVRYRFKWKPKRDALVGAPAGLRGLPRYELTMNTRGRITDFGTAWMTLPVYTAIM